MLNGVVDDPKLDELNPIEKGKNQLEMNLQWNVEHHLREHNNGQNIRWMAK